MAEGGSLLPMPAQEVQMKVFQGGGTSSLLEMPEIPAPMHVFRGGGDFSIENTLTNKNVTFRNLTLQELIEAFNYVNTKKELPILVLFDAKNNPLTPLTPTIITVNNNQFTLLTGSMKMEGNKIKYFGKKTLDLEKTYFYNPKDGIELKGSFLSTNPANSSKGENILLFVYRETPPSSDYKNDIFEEEVSGAIEEAAIEEPVEAPSLKKKVGEGSQTKEKQQAIQTIKEKILKSKRKDSEVLSRIFQDKMGGEREAALVSMYLLRQDTKYLDKDIEELLDFLEFVKEPVSFVSFNGKKGRFPASTPLFQKVLQWDIQRKTQNLLEKLLNKKGVRNIKEEQKVVDKGSQQQSFTQEQKATVLDDHDDDEISTTSQVNVAAPVERKAATSEQQNAEGSKQEEQKGIIQDTTKIMEVIKQQGLEKDSVDKKGTDIRQLLILLRGDQTSYSKNSFLKKFKGEENEYKKYPSEIDKYFDSLTQDERNNLYYAYSKGFILPKLDDFAKIYELSKQEEYYEQDKKESNKITEWYNNNPLLILFWKVYNDWKVKKIDSADIINWKYEEFNNFVANLLLLTEQFKSEIQSQIKPETTANPFTTKSEFNLDNKLDLSIESFSIDSLLYRLFHLEYNTKEVEKVLQGENNWNILGYIGDEIPKNRFEEISWKGLHFSLNELYKSFEKNEEQQNIFNKYLGELFKDPDENSTAKTVLGSSESVLPSGSKLGQKQRKSESPPIVAWANQQPETQQKKRGRPAKGILPSRTQSAPVSSPAEIVKGGSRRVKKHITKTRRITKRNLTTNGVRGRVRKSRKAHS